ncbi:MAG: hypothetical protein IRY89_05190 [Pseudolabrys sp.]|nr:hypothetical protein [Pseudolabrys sp.]
MAPTPSPAEQSEHRVLAFRRGNRDKAGDAAPRPPVSDLAGYMREPGESPDDYRQRMIVNGLAFLFVLALIGAGLWLADTMTNVRKDQDCVLSGRRDCAPINVSAHRW